MMRLIIPLALLIVAGLIALTVLVMCVNPWPSPTPTPTAQPATVAPTATATATEIPTQTPVPVATATATRRPTVTALPTATPSPTPEQSCRRGVVTAHAAIPAVLATKPDRVCNDGCTYFASVLCQDIGKRLDLWLGNTRYPVQVVDCATWSVGAWPQKAGQDWLGEMDIRSWPDMPLTPLEAVLCE